MGGPDAGEVRLDGLCLDSPGAKVCHPCGQRVEYHWDCWLGPVECVMGAIRLDWCGVGLTRLVSQSPSEKSSRFSGQ